MSTGIALAEEPVVLGTESNISEVKRFPATLEEIDTLESAQKRISAHSAIVIDDSNGRILFAKAPDDPRQPASTIKILTGTIALKSLTGEESVPVSSEAASRPSSKMYLDPQKNYRADELISAVLLASANDASVALAEMLAGTESEFAEIMTLQAKYWGATNTVCKTATGLTAKGQTSTARDLALIFRNAMHNPAFVEKMQKRSMETDEGNKLYNHNKALWRIEGTEGGKTGYTDVARQTYVGKFTRGNSSIVVAIMGSGTMWIDLKYLVEYGFTQYQYISPTPEIFPPAQDLVAGTEPLSAESAPKKESAAN
jgi:D-alanyl-D-alanine carboxypeptidase (penicillin-binding protein 5/6)